MHADTLLVSSDMYLLSYLASRNKDNYVGRRRQAETFIRRGDAPRADNTPAFLLPIGKDEPERELGACWKPMSGAL